MTDGCYRRRLKKNEPEKSQTKIQRNPPRMPPITLGIKNTIKTKHTIPRINGTNHVKNANMTVSAASHRASCSLSFIA
jgi:hypothetical protein